MPELHYSRATTGEKVAKCLLGLLVLAAGARLGPGPVTVETWGEDPGPYLAAGFELTERNGGWDLILPG